MLKDRNLTDIIYQYKSYNFTWGKFDCCLFTIMVIEEYTGKTFNSWRKVLSKYNNYSEAKLAMKKLGCKKVEDLPSIILATPKKDISNVKLGEPVYYVNEKGEGLLGICNGAQAYFVQFGEGLVTRPIEDCIYSWSID